MQCEFVTSSLASQYTTKGHPMVQKEEGDGDESQKI
jgi:hypothetical protein